MILDLAPGLGRKALGFALGAACAFTLGACPRRPIRFGPGGELKDPRAVLAQVDRLSGRVLSLKAEAKVSVTTPRQSGTVGELVAVMRPAALHLETLDFFGKPVAVLASDGARFALFLAAEGQYLVGPATAENVSRLLPIVLEPKEAVMLLLGDVPRIPAEPTRLEIDEAARAYVVTLSHGAIAQRIWVGTEDFRPRRSEIRGAPAYDLQFDVFEETKAMSFPRRLELIAVDAGGTPTGTRLSLRYTDLELNPETDLTLFMLPQPPGTTLIEVDEKGRQKPGPGIGPAPEKP